MTEHMPPLIAERLRELEGRLSEVDQRARELEEALSKIKAERAALTDLIETIRWTISQIGITEMRLEGTTDGSRHRQQEPSVPLTTRVLNAMRELPPPITAQKLCEVIGGDVDIRAIGPVIGKLHKERIIHPAPGGGGWVLATPSNNNNHNNAPTTAVAGG